MSRAEMRAERGAERGAGRERVEVGREREEKVGSRGVVVCEGVTRVERKAVRRGEDRTETGISSRMLEGTSLWSMRLLIVEWVNGSRLEREGRDARLGVKLADAVRLDKGGGKAVSTKSNVTLSGAGDI